MGDHLNESLFYNLLLLPQRSVGARHSWALHHRCAPTAIWLWSVFWSSHAFVGGRGETWQERFLNTPGGSLCSRRKSEKGGGIFTWLLVALGKCAWSGKKWLNSHICECCNCFWCTTWLGDLWGGRNGMEGRGLLGSLKRGKGHHRLLFLLFFLSVFLISFPGRTGLLTGSQTGGVRMYSFRMVQAIFSSAGSAWNYTGPCMECGGGEGYKGFTVWLPL